MGGIQTTRPEVLGRNGTYIVFRKLRQRVAEFRQCLKANSTSTEDEELLAAKMMGRWRSVVVVGWVADTAGLSFATAGVEIDHRGFVRVDAYLRTSAPHIFAAGDITGRLISRLMISLEIEREIISGVSTYSLTSFPEQTYA
jgi:hypothetical protein